MPRISLAAVALPFLVSTAGVIAQQPAHRSRIDYALWLKYRGTVEHPCTTIKKEDRQRARENIERYGWARRYRDSVCRSADAILKQLTPDFVAAMIEPTTPGAMGPCPACRAQGLPWHPNGQWNWSPSRPDQLTCAACGTVFPNDEYPEDVVVRCTWGRGQEFTFIGGDTFRCFGYLNARPSLSGIIRARKVGYMTSTLSALATAYALTDEARYARGARAILLRFAAVFPEYLVRAGYGYGEYAGMDPHVAAERITNLPEDELVYPPNKPDRRVFTGFWSASRIGTSGTDGSWAARVTEAYDLTCTAHDEGQPVYSDDERMRIERDVLLESVYLAVCDERINNKAVANRTGAALVGMCVGQPELVRFGLEGFQRTVDEWFLPDGGTSESPAYALMTMSGIRPFALAFRDYSDPPGYLDSKGNRLDHFHACGDTLYGDCWQGLIWTLQGDLRFPPSADSYRTTRIRPGFAEMLALLMPTGSHFSLLKETMGNDPTRGGSRDAVFYRPTGLEQRDMPSFELHDVVFPYLAQGYLRTGQAGRQSLLLLNASDWGNHHHFDSLNLYYWKDGHELLSDLGYLWDHPDKHQTSCTIAHNLVMVDGREQVRRGRGGSYHLFSVMPRVEVMEASSQAYGPDCLYRRTCVLVDHGSVGDYVLDIFRAGGGQTRDCVFHGPNDDLRIEGLPLAAARADAPPAPELPLAHLRVADGASPWRASWSLDDDQFHVFVPGHAGEQVLVGDGWGQRDHRNTDRGVTLPYVVRRRQGQAACDAFVTVFVGGAQKRNLVEAVHIVSIESGDAARTVAVRVTTSDGVDLIVSSLDQQPVTAIHDTRRLTTDGRFAAILAKDGKPDRAVLLEGTRLDYGATHLGLPGAKLAGKILDRGSEPGRSWFVIGGGSLPSPESLVGQTLFAIDGPTRRAYPILAAERSDGNARIYTRHEGRGFEARAANQWELPLSTSVQVQ